MGWELALIGGAVASALLFSAWQKFQARRPPGLYKEKALLTPNEIEFYLRLQRALPKHIVLTQVSMGALLQPRISSRSDNKEFFRVRSKFAQKIVDYVVCDRELAVLAIIELDDRTHNSLKDAERDAMLKEAGYRTLRFESRNKRTVAELAKYF